MDGRIDGRIDKWMDEQSRQDYHLAPMKVTTLEVIMRVVMCCHDDTQ